MTAAQHAEMIGSLHDYKLYVEKCAEEHGWAGHMKHGDPAGWLFREVQKQRLMLASGRTLINTFRENEVRLHIQMVGVAAIFFVLGVVVMKWWGL